MEQGSHLESDDKVNLSFNIQLLHWNGYLIFPRPLCGSELKVAEVAIIRVGNHNGHQYLCPKRRKWIHAIETENDD